MLLLSLIACDPWALPDNGTGYLAEATWDTNVVPTKDGVYVHLPAANALALVKPDGTFAAVDLDGAEPTRLVAAPDGTTVLAFAQWPICEDDDPRIVNVSDCAYEDLTYGSELDIVRNGERIATSDLTGQFNAFAFTDDGSIAVAYLDLTSAEEIDVSGVLNLTEAVFVDVATGTTYPVPVGFAAEQVLFTADNSKAVVLSRSQVAVVDLTTWDVEVSFPLTLDADQEVTPNAVELVSSGGTDYALVSIEGRAELYVLDLTNESIDIVELDAAPSDLLVDTASDRTLIVSSGARALGSMDHLFFEVESIELDEPANRLLGGDGLALLYYEGASYKDVVLFDTTTKELTEFRAENPVMDMYLTSDRSYAVATLQTESGGNFLDQYYGLQIFDLADRSDPIALALQSNPVGFALTEREDGAYALLLLDGVDKLLSVDLVTAQDEEIELEAAPLGIAAIPEGGFVVTHPSGMGLLSFVDPTTGTVTTAQGYALANLAAAAVLPRRNVEE
jgi:hypothetical protein